MSGEWKGREVAIRVANDNAMTEDGLDFIEEAVTAMKYVSVDCKYCWKYHFDLLFCHVGSLHTKTY